MAIAWPPASSSVTHVRSNSTKWSTLMTRKPKWDAATATVSSLSRPKDSSRLLKYPHRVSSKIYRQQTSRELEDKYLTLNKRHTCSPFSLHQWTVKCLTSHSASIICHKSRHSSSKGLKISLCNSSVCQWMQTLKRPAKQLTQSLWSPCLLLKILTIVSVTSVWNQCQIKRQVQSYLVDTSLTKNVYKSGFK